MKRIDQIQMRKIYAIGKALGISTGEKDDNLHQVIGGMTGKDSVKDLSYREAQEVIIELQKRQGGYTPGKRRNDGEGTNVPGGMTAGQKRKAWALMYELEKLSEHSTASIGERLCGIIEKELSISAALKDPFRFLDYKAGNKLIEILKGYVKTVKRKAVKEDVIAESNTDGRP